MTPGEFSKLEPFPDYRADLTEIHFKLLPDRNKIFIFAFDYKAMKGAKPLVNIKIGKTVVRSRSKERADGSTSLVQSFGDN